MVFNGILQGRLSSWKCVGEMSRCKVWVFDVVSTKGACNPGKGRAADKRGREEQTGMGVEGKKGRNAASLVACRVFSYPFVLRYPQIR
jgi:hypothetical protein